jgi:UDP-glucose 4-epimerase
MKILITGGAGFIGSTLADRLLARGDEVLVLDNYSTARRDNLFSQERLKIIEGSIADALVVKSAFESFRPEVVVHAAASYKNPDAWIDDISTNVLGSAHVIKECQRAKVNRLVYFQTALCYGLQPEQQPVTLDHPINSRGSSYAISKTAGEHYIDLSGLDFVSLRLANGYGPRNITGPLPTFFHRLSTGKPCFVMDTRRDFIYVQDLVNVVEKAVDGKGSGYYHVASGADYSIKELFDEVVKALAIKLDDPVTVRERNPDDAYTILLDPTRTRKDFEWDVTTSLKSGIEETINYYREYGIEQTYTHLKIEAS